MTEFGSTRILVNSDLQLSEFILTLYEYDSIYAEYAWIEASTDSLEKLVKQMDYPPLTAARRIADTGTTSDFVARNALEDTRDALRIGKGGSESPWWIELIGRLNPLKALEKTILIIRDWKTEIERNRIQNELQMEEVRSKYVNRLSQEVDLVRNVSQLMRDVGLEDASIQRLVHSRCSAIVSQPSQKLALPKRYVSSTDFTFTQQDLSQLPEAFRSKAEEIGILHVYSLDKFRVEESHDGFHHVKGMSWRQLPGYWERLIGDLQIGTGQQETEAAQENAEPKDAGDKK